MSHRKSGADGGGKAVGGFMSTFGGVGEMMGGMGGVIIYMYVRESERERESGRKREEKRDGTRT